MPEPTLADQVTTLYDLIGGYHATNLIEVGRAIGVWEAITQRPGVSSDELARTLSTDAFYTDVLCRTAFAFELVDREGAGWRMAPHFDEILGKPDATFYLGGVAGVHIAVGRDYADYPRRFREGSTYSFGEHDEDFIAEVADAGKTLPRIFLDFVLPKLPALRAMLERPGARVLDVGCGGGWAIVQIAERFPNARCDGVDPEPRSIELANTLIRERRLADRCAARVLGAEGLAADGTYDVATSFLVVHEIDPRAKGDAFVAIARALRPGGTFLIFDEAFPESDEALRRMPSRFAALAQWFELTWGNRVDTRTGLRALCAQARLDVVDETTFSRFTILVAEKRSSTTAGASAR